MIAWFGLEWGMYAYGFGAGFCFGLLFCGYSWEYFKNAEDKNEDK